MTRLNFILNRLRNYYEYIRLNDEHGSRQQKKKLPRRVPYLYKYDTLALLRIDPVSPFPVHGIDRPIHTRLQSTAVRKYGIPSPFFHKRPFVSRSRTKILLCRHNSSIRETDDTHMYMLMQSISGRTMTFKLLSWTIGPLSTRNPTWEANGK